MADATPQSEIKRPTFKVIDVGDLVERLDPTRHDPVVEYVLGKKLFKREQREVYQPLP